MGTKRWITVVAWGILACGAPDHAAGQAVVGDVVSTPCAAIETRAADPTTAPGRTVDGVACCPTDACRRSTRFAAVLRPDAGSLGAGYATMTLPRPDTRMANMRSAARDEWMGEDKLQHFFMSFAATGFMFGGVRVAGLDRDPALVVGAAGSAAAGLWKEWRDRRAGGRFSYRDLAWNGLGIATAVVLLSRTR